MFLCLSLGLASVSFAAKAETEQGVVADTASITIHFRVAKTNVDMNFSDNARSYSEIIDRLKAAKTDKNIKIVRVVVVSAASPEGPYELNKRLSRQRADNVVNLIKGAYPSIPDNLFDIISKGEDWNLAIEFIANSNLKGKELAVEAMRDTTLRVSRNGKIYDGRQAALIELFGEDVWHYIVKEYFPDIRKTDVTIICETGEAGQNELFEKIAILGPVAGNYRIAAPQTSIRPSHIEVNEEEAQEMPIEKDHYTIALKTNLLYDAVTALNAGIEIPFGKNFSVEWMDVFPWWAWGQYNNKYAIQLWTMGPEVRWWFKRTDRRKYLTGHFLGLNVLSGRYDFQNDKGLCYQGHFWTSGITYGFALPVCKWLNMEFSASVGYVSSDYQHYEPGQDYAHLYRDKYNAGQISYFGPTSARVSLVLPLDFYYRKKTK